MIGLFKIWEKTSKKNIKNKLEKHKVISMWNININKKERNGENNNKKKMDQNGINILKNFKIKSITLDYISEI